MPCMTILYIVNSVSQTPRSIVDSQLGDSSWPLESSSHVCVGMYGFTYSLYHPERPRIIENQCLSRQRL